MRRALSVSGAKPPDAWAACIARSASPCVAAILGSSVVFLDGTVVNVALPAIRDDLDTGLAASSGSSRRTCSRSAR